MMTTSATAPQLSNIQTMILQGIKRREISMSSTALEYRPTKDLPSKERSLASRENERLLSVIKAAAISVDKLKLISDFSKVVDISIIERLVKGDRFDSLTRAEILDELIAASA